MKKIKIFLASSITDLDVDRVQVGDFFRQLNEIYLDRGVHISLIKCDDYDNAIAAGGKQAEYDREIMDSELCFFLFFRKVGDYTRHEFDVALDSYRKADKPKIVTYFKYVTSPEEATADVKAFMNMLDEGLEHYYNVYRNIDTLKLGILMQIKLMQLDATEPCVEDGKIKFGGEDIADVTNIPLFSGNQSLNELRTKLIRLTERYFDLRQRYLQKSDDEMLYAEYSRVASEKADIENRIRLAEKAVLEATKIMTEKTAKGSLSPRQVAAYHAFELGDYSGALEVLDLDAIMMDLRHNEQMAEGYLERIQINVNELLQRIKVLEADGIDKYKADEIKGIYQTVCERIEKYNLEKGPLYDYLLFLDAQNDYEQAIAVAAQLEYYMSNPKLSADDKSESDICVLIGNLYLATQRHSEAEEMYLKAVKICEQLAAKNADEYESDLAVCYLDLGNLYSVTQRYSEAEETYLKVKEIYERSAVKNPEAYELNLAATYNNLGQLRYATKRYSEAEEAHLKAKEIYERLAAKNPDANEPSLAVSYNNLGILYVDTQRYSEAEDAHLKAKEIYERAAAKNPDAYEPQLAKSYHNLGILYADIKRYNESEKTCLKSKEIYERLAAKNPDAYEPYLAANFHTLGSLYADTKRYSEAEEIYLKAEEIYERLVAKNPDVYELGLARSYNNRAVFYNDIQRYGEAEENNLKAKEIYERLAAKNPSVYELDLARICNSLGKFYQNNQRNKEAEENCLKAEEIYERLAAKNPGLYELVLLAINSNLSIIYFEQKNLEKSAYYFQRSSQLAENYKSLPECAEIYEGLCNIRSILSELVEKDFENK